MNGYGVALFALIAITATAVAAEENLSMRPQSCTALATVQLNDCSVINAFRCGEGELAFFRYEGHDVDGPDLVNHMNQSYGLIAAADGAGGAVYISRIASEVAEAPLEQVFLNGTAPFSYAADLSLLGISKPVVTVGTLRAQSGAVTVSGHRLRRIRSDIEMTMPAPVGTLSGWYMIYVAKDLGLVFEGEGEVAFGGDSEKLPSSPASIALPGEVGFGTTIPTSGCGEFSFAPTLRTQQHEDKT